MTCGRRLMFISFVAALAFLPFTSQSFPTSLAARKGIAANQMDRTSPDQGSLIENGSFELASVTTGAFLQLLAGDTSITHWTVLAANIDYIGTFFVASNGTRSIDLDGNSAGGIQQTFRTVPGERYTVTFDLAGNPLAAPAIKTARVSAAGQSMTFTFDITGKTATNMGWTEKTWSFIANDTVSTLQFMSLTGSGAGPALDNVRVTGRAAPFICLPPPPGIVSWWRGEGNANDFRGGNNGVLLNGATFAPGLVGQAFKFDGGDDYVLVPHSTSLNFAPNSSITLEAWIYRKSSALTQHIMGKRAGCDSNLNFYQMAFAPGVELPPSAVPLDAWTHLAETVDKDTGLARVYINGSLYSAVKFAIGANTAPFTIGASGTCQGFAGLIDEPTIYDRALTESEVRAIYYAGKTGKCTVATVSAANFKEPPVAIESIVASFGDNLATGVQPALGLPLPTSLLGTTIKITDQMGDERLDASLFFVSPAQVNYQIPPGTAAGAAGVTITSGNGAVSYGAMQIATAAPGLFAANANGQGVPAGYVLRVKSDGSQITEPIARFDSSQNKYVPLPIDFGAATDQVFLILFGTGIRYRSSLSATTASIGGTNVPVLYAGPQNDFVGLDQVNLSLPRTLAGRNDVDLVFTADGKAANTLLLSFK